MRKRPHILFLMSDEHRADVAGYAGNAVVRTPVLDELAQEAVVFCNCYTPSPICIPARQCLMAGQLPKTCGCRNYGDDLAPNSMSWARVFSQHAYNTVCCGKLHHMGTDQMQGWRRRISFDDVHVDARYVEGFRKDVAAEYSGGGKWSDTKEVLRAGIGKSPHAVADEFSVAAATQLIEQYFASPFYDKASTVPLLLKVSLLLPHYPYLCDEEKFVYYLNRVQPFTDETIFEHPFLSEHRVRVGGDSDVTERDLRRATAAYYGMTETIDAQFGEVLSALRRVGQDPDDWIIVYTSDHGEMLGQHGIWEKQKFFEGSVRVPLLIRWPKSFKPREVQSNVNLCDLFATLCELSGLPIPDGLDSRSLVPLMKGENENWNDETISEFGARNLMIKRGALKYQYYGEAMPEVLFDLEADAGETKNFLDAPEYSGAMQKFRERCAQLGHGPCADEHYAGAGY